MGDVKGPSVALNVFLVFLLPIVVFIIGLVVSRELFAGLIRTAGIGTLISVVFAAAVAFLSILIIRNVVKNR